jgi:phosphinothricin acetyltransferase
MNIRIATAQDAEAVQSIYEPVVRHTTISFELEPPSVDEMRSRIVSTLKRLPWLVSEDDSGRVNGYVYAGKHRDPAAYQWSVNTSAYVREDSRAQGVGKQLYLRLFEHLVALGYFQAFAGIALPNAPSIGLHESVGFRPIGVYRNVGFKHAAWRDVGWWQRPLRDLADPVAPSAIGAEASPGDAPPSTAR